MDAGVIRGCAYRSRSINIALFPGRDHENINAKLLGCAKVVCVIVLCSHYDVCGTCLRVGTRYCSAIVFVVMETDFYVPLLGSMTNFQK